MLFVIDNGKLWYMQQSQRSSLLSMDTAIKLSSDNVDTVAQAVLHRTDATHGALR